MACRTCSTSSNSSRLSSFFITGAIARDLILQYGYGINTGRETRDVDFAFSVETWKVFEEIRSKLIRTEKFIEVLNIAHRLRQGEIVIDLVPFGSIERPDRTIAWPLTKQNHISKSEMADRMKIKQNKGN